MTIRVDRIRTLSSTHTAFQRPSDFFARQFFLKDLLPDSENQEGLVSVYIEGKPQAINDLCSHWLLGYTLTVRTEETAQFKLPEEAVYNWLPYSLLSYGGSIRVLEPSGLKECMVGVTAALLDYYRMC